MLNQTILSFPSENTLHYKLTLLKAGKATLAATTDFRFTLSALACGKAKD